MYAFFGSWDGSKPFPSHHLTENLWLPSGPGHILLSLFFCSSVIVPLPPLSPHALLWKYEILTTIRPNTPARLHAGSFNRMAFAWMFTDIGFLFVYQCASQSGLVYLWTDQHPPKSFFGSVNVTRRRFISVTRPWAATCQRKFLEKIRINLIPLMQPWV